MKNLKTLKDRLKFILFQRELTYRDVADAIGCTQQAVAYMVSGKTKNPRKVIEMSRFLGVSVEYLLEGDPEDVPNVGDEIITPPEKVLSKKSKISKLIVEFSEIEMLSYLCSKINLSINKGNRTMETVKIVDEAYYQIQSNALHDPYDQSSPRAGDLAHVEFRDDWQPGDIVAVKMSKSELKIRRIIKDGSDVRLISAHEFQYPPILWKSTMKIIGIVVGFERRVTFKK